MSEHTRILILGSYPGRTSLAEGSYYAHRLNRFWPLMSALLDEPLVRLDAAARLERLDAAGVGLWDVVAAADRPGSLDRDIDPTSLTDVPALAASLPALRLLAFNGEAAWRLSAPWRRQSAIATLKLPSTSPTRCRPFAELIAAWEPIGLRDNELHGPAIPTGTIGRFDRSTTERATWAS